MNNILTAEQARAIRNATSICFDHADYLGQIRAIRRAGYLATDFANETTTTIPLGEGASRVDRYDSGHGGPGSYTCFAMIMSAAVDLEWRTVCRQIKAGSTLYLRWVRGNASPVTNEAGLVVDYLTLVVQNKSVNNYYRVANYVGLDNSARMVRV